MKIFQVVFFILLSVRVSGQLTITGVVKDYHNQEILPFVSINADTIFYNIEKFTTVPPDTATTNQKGSFTLRIKNPKLVNLTFSFIGYVPLTINNINVDGRNQNLDLGVIYLPYRGQWFEGYRNIKEGKGRSTRQKERKAWKKEGLPNCSGFVNDFLDPYLGKEYALIEYPPSSSKKYFLIKKNALIINFEEFNKK